MMTSTARTVRVPLQTCEGCGADFINIFDTTPVCMDCVEARARCVTRWNGSCKCGTKRREGEPQGAVGQRYGRVFTSCARCLGTVRQIR